MMLPSIPQEIVEDILSKLPVKSLLRFRCVCKSWNSLITSAPFINMHFAQRTSDPNNENSQLLLILSEHHPYSLDLPKMSDNYVAAPLELDFPSEQYTVDQLQLVGSSNGLILIAEKNETLFLLNPSTRESKRLPDWPFLAQPPPELIVHCTVLFGFGHYHSLDDYKVVRFIHFYHLTTLIPLYNPMVGVYTLRTNVWRVMGISPYKHLSNSPSGTLLNGIIHWLDRQGSDGSQVIASFDLSKETFQDVPIPSSMEYMYLRIVGVLGGCLCMIGTINNLYHDVLVMKEYGVEESWTKFRISHPHPYPLALCCVRNYIVLLGDEEDKLLLHDLKEQTSIDLVILGKPILKAAAYVESLISPNVSDAIEGPH